MGEFKPTLLSEVPKGVEILGYHPKWVDADFNPKGIRAGFFQEDLEGDDVSYKFISAYWLDYQDTYLNDDMFIPEKWCPFPELNPQ